VKEIPPRVRRRGCFRHLVKPCSGNTSACAEKSIGVTHSTKHDRKYLRVCGEEGSDEFNTVAPAEIPPRVRRREDASSLTIKKRGNTSACAEKRAIARRRPGARWKYLRVCGEEGPRRIAPNAATDIPPRLRSRAALYVNSQYRSGDTSAWVENRAIARRRPA